MTDRKEPVPHTCPRIDEIKGVLQQCVKDLEYADKLDDLEEIKSYMSSIAWDLCGLYEGRGSQLEVVRDANDKLRTWGNDLVSDVENLENRVTELENMYSYEQE